MDEVWLSKPYTLDCLDSLKRQNCITKRRQKLHSEEVQHIEVKEKVLQRRCPPPLLESNVDLDLDCDSQPNLNADFEAGGDDEVMDEDM